MSVLLRCDHTELRIVTGIPFNDDQNDDFDHIINNRGTRNKKKTFLNQEEVRFSYSTPVSFYIGGRGMTAVW